MSPAPEHEPLEEPSKPHENGSIKEPGLLKTGNKFHKRDRPDQSPAGKAVVDKQIPTQQLTEPAEPTSKNKSSNGHVVNTSPTQSTSLKRRREDEDQIKTDGETPRARKRPGTASRIPRTSTQAIFSRQREREASSLIAAAQTRGVDEIVKQHYNAVPQRGRDWRKTDSRIKGLRSFNNWVKSTIIHKFSPAPEGSSRRDDLLNVLDIGCGKGGDLGKWAQAPQPIGMYVGVDPAEVSIDQARERYQQMRPRGGYGGGRGRGGGGGGGGGGGRQQRVFDAAFMAEDAFAFSLGDLPIIREIGFGPGSRWGPSGGFDVVSMMFCMHYAFETEAKAKGMLNNVASCLCKGGRFIGVIPNSDVIREGVIDWYGKRKKTTEAGRNTADPATNGHDSHESTNSTKNPPSDTDTDTSDSTPNWGNSLYNLRFPPSPPAPATPADGIFRPPYGWKYSFFLSEAVEEVPEYVVPWEAFRAIAEDYQLELQYRKSFREIWDEEGGSAVFGPLSERMGVRGRDGGDLLVSEEEMDVAGFYHAFCFYKI